MADDPNPAPAPSDPAPAPAADPAPAPAPAPAEPPKAADPVPTPAPKPAESPKHADTPVDYGTLKLPDGYKTDDPVFADAVKMFGEQKLSTEQAQKLIDFTVERDKSIAKAVNDSNATAWGKQRDTWKAETAKQNSAEALGFAKTAFTKVFDAETAKYLEALGFTDHPGFVRGMVAIFKAIKDDTWVSGNAVVNGAGDARRLFPKSNMNP